MKTKGILIVVSGFAGAGKGTLVNELLKQLGADKQEIIIKLKFKKKKIFYRFY